VFRLDGPMDKLKIVLEHSCIYESFLNNNNSVLIQGLCVHVICEVPVWTGIGANPTGHGLNDGSCQCNTHTHSVNIIMRVI